MSDKTFKEGIAMLIGFAFIISGIHTPDRALSFFQELGGLLAVIITSTL